ncbi:thioredoxin domain-containing protein [Sanguibacter sp. HDW7]|uniref:thioredoxin domain-containing protein n=1 Tax=Sanguibacter sp. HDW7 TaxID=2714931 RepID=UPI0014092DDC|nr:thioredoxin domain-containing protein [Sanguibacter sp. HDW7]QIK82320.1 thioredoxin domain-containing protein [Sanguibacter sp. HDW7]
MPNRLAHSLSPYLRQHAGNPVAWHEWSDAAFAEAHERDVPVLVSIGYAACHWCHVMARESFSDPEVGALMDAGFVSIKVDREERPDVDAVHMAALLALTGQGGWPLTAVLTPDGRPFIAGTYYPPEPVGGQPSFRQLLDGVQAAWHGQREAVERQADALAAHLRRTSAADPSRVGQAPDDDATAATVETPATGPMPGARRAVAPGPDDLTAAVEHLLAAEDRVRGGFGGAPKFPPSATLLHLLRHHGRTGDARALGVVRRTVLAMTAGGLHDQLGGGYARYCVDATWTVPHFEKMLTDNAQLLAVLTGLWRATGEDWVRTTALQLAAFLEESMLTTTGFATSLDADTDGAEGTFYVWTPAQLRSVLGDEDGSWAADVCAVTDAGTFEHGTSVLRLDATVLTAPTSPTSRRIDAFPPSDEGNASMGGSGESSGSGVAPGEGEGARWARVRARLRDARGLRTHPARDDKVVAGWNGLAIGALAEAGRTLDAPHLVDLAAQVADAVVTRHLDDDVLRRTSLGERVSPTEATLEDHGLLADGLLQLHAATGDARWYDVAARLVDRLLDRFVAGDAFYDAPPADDGPALVVRPGDPTDGSSPSGRSAAAGALVRIAALSGEHRHLAAAHAALAPYRALAHGAPRSAGWGLAVAEALADGPRCVVLAGAAPDGPLAHATWAATSPGTVLTLVPAPDRGAAVAIPAHEDRGFVGGLPTAYVCRGTTCSLPQTTPEALAALLATAPA